MLDTCITQAAGLQQIALQAEPRVIAMASHGNQQGELPLLWSLCATLADFGFSVAVLDAFSEETPECPGLAGLLEDSYWRQESDGDSPSWSVFPSATGLARLAKPSTAAQGRLGALGACLQGIDVILIYARADMLVQLLPETGIQPLLTVSPLKMSGVTAYQALKQLLLNAGLKPTVASIAMGSGEHDPRRTAGPIRKLQECAMEFLGYQLESVTIRAGLAESQTTDDIHRLTLSLLENAIPVARRHAGGVH
jgi:hypothetical protein